MPIERRAGDTQLLRHPCISNEHHHPSVGVSQKARDPVELLPVLPAKLGPSRNVAVLVVIGHVIYGLDRSF